MSSQFTSLPQSHSNKETQLTNKQAYSYNVYTPRMYYLGTTISHKSLVTLTRSLPESIALVKSMVGTP